MEEIFTMRCNNCGKDYQASREAIYTPFQICRHCTEEMYKQTPVASVTVGQKFVPKDGTPRNVLRVVDISELFVELERCEHHEGLAHETFPMHIERLLKEYIPEDNK